MVKRFAAVILAGAVLAPLAVPWGPAAAAGDWPGFRGPTGQGHSAETRLPLTWDAATGVAWTADVPGEGWSSPIVWGDHVVVTTATDGGRTCRVLAFDRRTGAPRFDTKVFEQATPRKERQNSYATPTPCTDGRRVYAVFGAGGVAAVDFDGKLLWTNREVDHYSRHGLGASPLLVGGLLVMPYDGSQRVEAAPPKAPVSEAEKVGWKTPWEDAVIVALDPATGRRVWAGRRGLSRVGHVTPLVVEVAGEQQLISVAGDCIQGFRPGDGRRLWSLFAQGEGVVPTPAAGDGLLFTSSGFEATALRAVRLGPNPAVVWKERRGVPTRPSPVYASPYLYAVTDAGIASCWEGATGKLVWRERLPGEYSASPVFADGRLYCLNEAGETTVLAAGPAFKVLARNPLGAKCQASMAVARGQLLIRTERQLVAVGRPRD